MSEPDWSARTMMNSPGIGLAAGHGFPLPANAQGTINARMRIQNRLNRMILPFRESFALHVLPHAIAAKYPIGGKMNGRRARVRCDDDRVRCVTNDAHSPRTTVRTESCRTTSTRNG